MISLRNLYERDHRRCFYCNLAVWLTGHYDTREPVRLEFGVAWSEIPLDVRRKRAGSREHLIRRIDGGSDRGDNIVLACYGCNCSRGATAPELHILAMRAISGK